MKTNPPRGLGLVVFGSLLKWLGLFGMVFGLLSSAVAVRFLFSEAKRRSGEFMNFEPMIGSINRVALGLLLASMFFTLAGSGLLLVSRPLTRYGASGAVLRWPRFLSYVAFAYSAAALGLAVILINELSSAVSGGSIGGLVTYCVLVAIGLLITSWGLKRFADAD